MKLFVLAESAQSDKLQRLLEQYSSDDETLILCATAAQEGDLGRAFAHAVCPDATTSSPQHSTHAVRVMSFGGFVAQLWNRWGDSRALVGAAIRTKTADQVLRATKVPPALQTAGGTTVFARLAAAFVPATASHMATAGAKGLHQVLEQLLRDYHKTLEADGYIEHSYAIQLLAEKIERASVKLENTHIIVSGFRDFTLPQLKLLCACAQQSETTVILDWEEGRAATDYTGKTLSLLLEQGARQRILTPPSDLALSDGEKVHGSGGAAIVFGRAQGHAAELALMADFAQELQQQYPNQPKALLIPSIKNYLRPLATQLEQRAVPFELDVKTPFGATGFGAALLALLRVCIGDDQQANGLAFALSAYSGLSPDQVLELDTRWRRYRVSPASMLTQLSQHPSGACDSLRLIRSSSMSARIGDWSSLVTQLYARGAQAHRSSNFDLLQDAAAQKSATTALQELYEQKFAQHTKKLQLADGVDDSDDQQPGSRILSYDPRITAAELYASLRETLIAQTPKAASPAILIAQPARVYGRQFHSVIVGGLAAESETEKADNSLDVRLAATLSGTPTPDLAQQQQFNYYAIRSLAQHNLYLVAQHETLGGETLKPGGLLRMVQQDQNSKAQHSDQQIACRYKSNDEVIASQSYATAEKQAEIEGILAQTQPPLHLRQPPRGEAAYFDLGYGDKSPVAATTLQDFENCPYYWLLHRFAAGKEVDRGFDRREQGTFAHQVLKLFYEELPISGIGERITGANLDEALDLYQQIFDKEAAKLQEKLPFTLAEQAELVMLGSMLADFLQSEVDYAPEFVPRYLEYRFGYDATGSDGPDSATTEPVDLGLGLPLRGSIDRIDVRADDDAALIIDYKRTSDVGGLVAQANNNLFQGVLYRLVAEKVLPIRPVSHSYRAYGDINAKPSEAYAREDNPPERPLGLPKIGRAKIGGLSEKEMHEGFEKILESAGRAAHDLHIGRVEKRANRSLCQYCLYDGCEHKPRQGGRR